MDNKDLRNMVNEMLDTEDCGFTDWEIEFLDNMKNWTGDYTDRQTDKIEKIYKDRMG